MGVFDQDTQQQVKEKAKEGAHQVGEGLSKFGKWVGKKAHDVANSEQMDLAGHATRDALTKLKDATGVVRLNLSHNPLLTDRDLGSVSGLRNLTHLDLGFNTKLTDQGLNALRGNQNLQHLNLENTLLTGATLAFLPHAALVSLVLKNNKNLNIANLSQLGNMRALEKLDLSQNTQIGDAALPQLKKLTQVKDLDLRGTGMTDRAVAELKKALPHASIRH